MTQNRWKMNQLGFVNFWLYDKETFQLEDGKILLRGQNGSGKSITTQSFIPFILDGDRTPARLDPFGTSDRKMDYYFLGDGDKEEATGYLFLEFKKEETNEYKTIGIGQTARRGKPMSFWGFILEDGRRIGKDVELYRKSGNQILPFTKQELRKEFGENTFITDSQKEYKEQVNKKLFDFPRIDQYDQYIKLLIKVRAPKLSNTFKPTKVYEILNDSLQVLSDEDLRPMVDAMEKMDSIQENLETLKKSRTDAKEIMKEYIHYNKYILSKKAHQYLKALEEEKESLKDYNDKVLEINKYKEEEKECTKSLNALLAEEERIRKEIEQLTDPSIVNLDIKKQNLEKELNENNQRKQSKENATIQKKEQIRSIVNQIQKYKENVDLFNLKIHKSFNDLEVYQNEIQFNKHREVKKYCFEEERINLEEIQSQINTLKTQVQEGRASIYLTKEAEEKYQEANLREENNQKILSDKQNIFSQIETQKEKEQDNLLNQIENLKENKYWILDKETIEDIRNYILDFKQASDSLKYQNRVLEDYNLKIQAQENVIATINAEKKQLEKEKATQQEEFIKVQNQKEIEPVRDEKTIETRRKLKELGIEAIPFYQAIDFSSKLSEKEQAILEQELNKAGILDALVVSDLDYKRIQEECPYFIDTILHETEYSNSSYTDLVVDSSISNGLQEAVTKIVSNFSSDHGVLELHKNGYFKHGILEGHVEKAQSEFIGFYARQRRKKQLLDEMQSRIEELEHLIKEKEEAIVKIQEYKEEMAFEYQSLPKLDVLNSYLDELYKLNIQIQDLLEKKEQFEKETQTAYDKYKSNEREMLKICSQLPYARKIEEYDTILQSIDEYKEILNRIQIEKEKVENASLMIQSQEESLEQREFEREELYLELQSFENKTKSLESQLLELENLLKNPELIEKIKKLDEAHKKEEENKKKQDEKKQRLAVVSHDLQNGDEEIEKKRILEEENKEKLRKCQLYFEEEANLNYVFDSSNKTIEERAKEALSYEEERYKQKSSNEMTTNLMDSYQKNNSLLSPLYSTSIEKQFENEEDSADRMRISITSVWEGKKLDLKDFISQLENSISIREELIKQKDRELFEDILSQTISNKLTSIISESKSWVKEMSNLMKKMDTSMGLSFALDWKPKNPELEEEMDVKELEKILAQDIELLSDEDITKVSNHFRSIVQKEKQRQEMNNEIPNYLELVRNALDYRKWYEFKMSFIRVNEGKKDLTNAAFNRFSGGEKAMAMYVPLFAAVNAQYQKARKEDHPKMIALDEAFAGVDDKNIASMFEMVDSLDFDYIMNSQVLWGCYNTVKHLKISELLRPQNSNYITVINYIWNGKEKRMQ